MGRALILFGVGDGEASPSIHTGCRRADFGYTGLHCRIA